MQDGKGVELGYRVVSGQSLWPWPDPRGWGWGQVEGGLWSISPPSELSALDCHRQALEEQHPSARTAFATAGACGTCT